MIEVLVTLIVLALGLLGVAGLQIQALRGGQEGLQRSHATMLVNDALDRMRANPERIDTRYDGAVLGLTDPNAFASPTGSCGTGSTQAQCLTFIAERDLMELNQAVWFAESMVQARLCIFDNPARNGDVTVVLAWRGLVPNAAAGGAGDCDVDDIDASYLQVVTVRSFIDPTNPH